MIESFNDSMLYLSKDIFFEPLNIHFSVLIRILKFFLPTIYAEPCEGSNKINFIDVRQPQPELLAQGLYLAVHGPSVPRLHCNTLQLM